MAARLSPEHYARWKRQGVHPMEASAALSALEIALRSQRPQTAIMDVDWQRFVEGRSAREAALFEELMRPRNKDAATAQRADDPLSMLRTAPANERKSRLANQIRSSARKVLSMDATSPIQDDVPLQEIGLDSLMALELRNELAQSLELTLSAGLLFNYPTVAELAEHLHSLIFTPTAEPAPIRVLDTDDLEAVKSLTDEEAELLLVQELEGSGGTVHA
jgi:acyl carrier protein